MNPIPVILLSGFLGAGKTTLLRHLLSWESDFSDTVVIVNEFGKIGIDGQLVKQQGTTVVELANGCICCTLSIDLKTVLNRILARFSPRRIIIEASGIADPTAIISAIQDESYRDSLRMAHVITVLNADDWDAREVFGHLFYNQLHEAHVILLNKVDLIELNRVSQMLNEINDAIPGATVIPTLRCRVDPETLWSASADGSKIPKLGHFFQPLKDAIGLGFIAFDFESDEIMDEDFFHQFVQQLPQEVFRIKGPVNFSNRTELFNYVGGRSEWSEWHGENQTRLAFIGINIRAEDVLWPLHNSP